MVFPSLAFMQIGQALASRSSERCLFAKGLLTNPALPILVAVTFGLPLAAIYVPFLQGFVRIVPLAPVDLLVALGLGVLVFVVLESAKAIFRRRAAADEPTTP